MRKRAGLLALGLGVLAATACGSSNSASPGGAGMKPTGPGMMASPPPDGGSGPDAAAPDTGTSPTPEAGACGTVGSGMFMAPNAWTQDVSCDPPDPSSAAMMSALAAAGGWGTGATSLQIDMSLVVLHADGSTPMVPFTEGPSYATPDCDTVANVPMPVGGAIEGMSGYTCDTSQNDCHLLVEYPPTNTLYEVYQANMVDGSLVGGCAVLWNLTKSYPINLRGDQCTSADAAGFPMSAMLPDADEVASGKVLHAIRFALPNARMRAGVYVHPATHAGGPSGDASLPPYGVRLRLRADYPLASLPSDGARVLATALQHFGMFLSDGGNVPLMVQSDQFTTNKWAAMNLDSHALFGIAPTDFDVVDLPPTVPLTYDCVRNP